MAKSIQVYKTFTGKYPKGWVAPAHEVSNRTMKVLEDFGLQYDHSMFHHDCLPYYVADTSNTVVYTDYSKNPETWMIPLQNQKPTSVVEIPGSWSISDWGLFIEYLLHEYLY